MIKINLRLQITGKQIHNLETGRQFAVFLATSLKKQTLVGYKSVATKKGMWEWDLDVQNDGKVKWIFMLDPQQQDGTC